MAIATLIGISIPILIFFHLNKKEDIKMSSLFLHLELQIEKGIGQLKAELRREKNNLRSEKEIKKIMKAISKEGE